MIYQQSSDENLQSSQVKLWSVFNMHHGDMKRGLYRVLGVGGVDGNGAESEVMGGFYATLDDDKEQ